MAFPFVPIDTDYACTCIWSILNESLRNTVLYKLSVGLFQMSNSNPLKCFHIFLDFWNLYTPQGGVLINLSLIRTILTWKIWVWSTSNVFRSDFVKFLTNLSGSKTNSYRRFYIWDAEFEIYVISICFIKNHSLWAQERIFAGYISVDLMRLTSRHVLIFDFPIFVVREIPFHECLFN